MVNSPLFDNSNRNNGSCPSNIATCGFPGVLCRSAPQIPWKNGLWQQSRDTTGDFRQPGAASGSADLQSACLRRLPRQEGGPSEEEFEREKRDYQERLVYKTLLAVRTGRIP